MNVMGLVHCVTLMLHVLTLLGVLCACVRKATVAMGLSALVSTLIHLRLMLYSSTDIDECEAGFDDCNVNAVCTNIDGNYTCSCSSGYSGNGTFCSGKPYLSLWTLRATGFSSTHT